MTAYSATDLDLESALGYLNEHGYVVIEGLLGQTELEQVRGEIEDIYAREREAPFDPGDGDETPDDAALEEYLFTGYKITEAERDRLMRRIRHTRELNHGTPWPVPPQRMNKSFLHVPTLFDYDKSQRVMNLPKKMGTCGRLIEDPTVLRLVRAVLDEDCVLSDISATSIGPHTDGGAWHIDVPLTQLPEPLPEIPLTMQNAWMLDDFTAENGATRIVPGSHLTRKKPTWGYEPIDGEIILEAPAGSVAIWISNTWHHSGPNFTDRPRRAILGYYCRSWIKPHSNYAASLSADVAQRYSPTARYLLGWSASGPERG